MAERYTNIRVILDKLLRHPLMSDLPLETAVDYTVEFFDIMGVPDMFINKVETLKVENYRAVLPCDYSSMIQVRKTDGSVFRYTTDSFHLSNIKNIDKREFQDLTYKVQGSIIYTSLKECEIEISYEAIATDDEGYPLLPDNGSFTRALELYIKKKWFTIQFELGKVNMQVLQNIQQEYAWAAGDCQTEFNRLSLDKAESFYNTWKSMLIRDTEHRTGFKNTGTKERIKVQ